MMRVLVTGGCGFVGRRFVKRFADFGDEVTLIDNMIAGVPLEDWVHKPEKTDKLKVHFADCRTLLSALKSGYWDLIVHCAAVVGGRMKIEDDTLAVATNLSIDSEFFNWVVRDKKPPKVIYFSSSAIYPPSWQTKDRHKPLPEDYVDVKDQKVELPDRTYGFSKLAGEVCAHYACEEYGLDVHIYRPFGGYGEDQSFDYPFPSIIKRIVMGEDPVKVWGSGEQRRDFIYIDDVVDCVLQTMDEKPGTTLNIGSGVGTSFIELAQRACKVMGEDRLVRNDPSKPEGVFWRVADIDLMNRYYTPRITLDDGIERVAHHIKKTMKKAHIDG
jgi:GDP-L-fucose synthase